MRTTEELRHDALKILDEKLSYLRIKILSDTSEDEDGEVLARLMLNLNIRILTTLDNDENWVTNSGVVINRVSYRNRTRMSTLTSSSIIEYTRLLDLKDRYMTEDPTTILQSILEDDHENK